MQPPCKCDEDYLELHDEMRNVNEPGFDKDKENYCDRNDAKLYRISPDWKQSGAFTGGSIWAKGGGCYRFTSLSSNWTMMPVQPVEPNHCGTRYSGYFGGNHPTNETEPVWGPICFKEPNKPEVQ